jgi:hypothetical protein
MAGPHGDRRRLQLAPYPLTFPGEAFMTDSSGEASGAEYSAFGTDPAGLRDELRKAQRAYQQEFNRLTPSWKFAIGPLRFQLHIGSTAITWVYTVFNFICLAAGISATLARGIWTSLGVALVVGALFSFGTFVAQWWLVEMTREDKISDYLGRDPEEYAKLARLFAKTSEVARQLRQAESEPRPPQ